MFDTDSDFCSKIEQMEEFPEGCAGLLHSRAAEVDSATEKSCRKSTFICCVEWRFVLDFKEILFDSVVT